MTGFGVSQKDQHKSKGNQVLTIKASKNYDYRH